MMPPFRGSSVKRYGPEIQRAARAMTATWRAGRELSALAELHRVTLDIILGITFGTLAAMAQQELRTSLERFLKLGTSPLANAVLWLTPKPKVEPWIYRPVRASRTLARLLPWSSVVDAQDAMDRLIYRTIRARRAAPDPDANDLLSLLLRARDDDGEGMSDVELRDQIVTLLLAGHETTATTLAWTLAHLMASPAIYAKVATTLRARVLAEGPLSIDAIMDDPWLDGCLKESMRLSPVAPTVGRHLGAPTKIGRYDLPAGVNAIACVYLAQRRADHFEKPRAFRPERWFDQRVPPYDFFPFGGGSRRCLGMALAYYEMKIVLAEMLIAVDLESGVPRPLIPVRKGVTFAPIDGLPVRVLRRHQEGSLHGSAQPSLRSNARSS